MPWTSFGTFWDAIGLLFFLFGPASGPLWEALGNPSTRVGWFTLSEKSLEVTVQSGSKSLFRYRAAFKTCGFIICGWPMLLKEWMANDFLKMWRPMLSILAEHIISSPKGAGGRNGPIWGGAAGARPHYESAGIKSIGLRIS